MTLITIAIAGATFLATLVGGLFALRLRDNLHLILGFSAGAVLGVALFDLLPEALSLTLGTYDATEVSAVIAIGFLLYMIIDRFVMSHGHDSHHTDAYTHDERGILGAGSLALHSFLDGLAIGLAFQVSAAVGAVVTTAVLVHDFSDGINTVNLILKGGGDRDRAYRWLVVDALAPVFGIAVAFLFNFSEAALGLLLALFCGFFLYIGASELLPESYHDHPRMLTSALTMLGVFVMFAAIKVAGI